MLGFTTAFLLSSLSLAGVSLGAATAARSDPCTVIAGKTFVAPAKAMACLKSFPFNETLRQNVLTNVARIFDFYTFEDYYLNLPPPFQDSTVNIRAEIARINSTKYTTDYDFNRAVQNFTSSLNDGHTRFYPNCYMTFYNLLAAPLVTWVQNGVHGVFVAPFSPELMPSVGSAVPEYFASIGFDWQRLAGARVLKINGMDPYAYGDLIADTESGNFLDHGVRFNGVFGSYALYGPDFAQRLGDISIPHFPDRDSLTLTLITVNSTKTEVVTVPYLAGYYGGNFTDSASYWAANCAANDDTNGVDRSPSGDLTKRASIPPRKPARAVTVDYSPMIPLPSQFVPTLPLVAGSTGMMKNFILPGNKTGVMFIGSFLGDFDQFQTDVDSAIKEFKASGVTHLLIDLSNNPGGYVCLGQFLHQYLAGGSRVGNDGGFQSSNRANPLAQKILAADIAKGLNASLVLYTADNFRFLNNTQMPPSYNYFNPDVSFRVNGVTDHDSQRDFDACSQSYYVDPPTTPPFDLNNVAIVGNGNCASTCAMFSTVMYERHQTKIAVFGGKPGEEIQYKGMAGNQVLEWPDLATEIKTAGLQDDPLAPPDLLVNANMRLNWRTAFSYLNEENPIAFESELPQYRFDYTPDTYNNMQNLWIFAEKELFHIQ